MFLALGGLDIITSAPKQNINPNTRDPFRSQGALLYVGQEEYLISVH